MTAYFKRGKFASGCRNSLTARLPGKRIMTKEEKKKPEHRTYFKSSCPCQEMIWVAMWREVARKDQIFSKTVRKSRNLLWIY